MSPNGPDACSADLAVASTPLRIPLGGDGTDLPEYSDRFGGDVLSVAINLRVTAAARASVDDRGDGRRVERTSPSSPSDERDDAIVTAAAGMVGVQRPCVVVESDPATPQAGPGRSGAFAVSVLAALLTLAGRDPFAQGHEPLAGRAWELAAGRADRWTGRHDPYVCCLGGVRRLVTGSTGVTVVPTRVTTDTLGELDSRLRLYGECGRGDVAVPSAVRSPIGRPRSLHEVKRLGGVVRSALEAGDVERVPRVFRQHWALAGTGVGPRWDDAHCTALRNGALGGKLVGAGDGGFLLLYCAQGSEDLLDTAMAGVGLRPLPFRFTPVGTTVTRCRYDLDGAREGPP